MDVLYSDEDKLDLLGARCDPYFKPDWSPDHFLTCMYTCHFMVMRRTVLTEVGGFRAGYEGAQDYDLLLRLHDGADPEEATATAIDTAGRAVLFAGTTVMISLLGMFLMGLKFVQGMAIAGSLAVLTMMIAAVTLLPVDCRLTASAGGSAGGHWSRLSSRRPGCGG